MSCGVVHVGLFMGTLSESAGDVRDTDCEQEISKASWDSWCPTQGL